MLALAPFAKHGTLRSLAYRFLLAVPALATLSTPLACALDLPQATTPTELSHAPTPVVQADDAALLAPLLAALGATPELRGGVLPQLYRGGDPRAIAALRYIALHDQQPGVRQAAARELARYADRRSIAALVDIATGVENDLPNAAALDALSQHVLTDGPEALYTLVKDPEADMGVRRHALEVLQRDHAEILAARAVPSLGGSALVATLGGGLFGGLALESVGGLAGGRNGADVIGGLTGAVIGAGAGYVFGRQVSNARQHYYMSAMTWGAFAGYVGARTLINRPYGQFGMRVSDEEVGLTRWSSGLTLAGELVGFGLAAYGADSLNLSSADVATADAIGIASLTGTVGLLGMMPAHEDQRAGYGVALLGGLAGAGVGTAVAHNLHFEHGDILAISYATVEGLYYGAQLRSLMSSSGDEGSGGLMGMGVGALATTALTQYIDPTPGNVLEAALFAQYGKALGAGLSLMASEQGSSAQWAQLAAGVAGFGAGAYLSQNTAYRSGDGTLLPIGTLLGVEHGTLIGLLVDGQAGNNGIHQSFYPGLVLTGAALGGLGGAVLSQYTDISPWETTMGSTGAVWGGWLVGSAWMLRGGGSTTAVAGSILAASDVGLAATALAVSPLVGADPRILAGANFGGMAGAGLCTLFTAMFSNNSDNIYRANLIGSGGGLLAGGILAYFAFADSEPVNKKSASAADLPSWLRLPVRSVSSAPHFDTLGRADGMVILADLDVWNALSPQPVR